MNDRDIVFDDKSGLDRLVFFSDAVMAIAITLLVIDLKVPETAGGLGPALRELWPNYLAYVFSFFIIGQYWLSHHRLFRPIRRYDDRLAVLNLLFLFFVALIPFSTRLIGRAPGARLAVVVYSLNILPLGLISYAMVRRAYGDGRLLQAGVRPDPGPPAGTSISRAGGRSSSWSAWRSRCSSRSRSSRSGPWASSAVASAAASGGSASPAGRRDR